MRLYFLFFIFLWMAVLPATASSQTQAGRLQILPPAQAIAIAQDFGDGFDPARHNFIPSVNQQTIGFLGNPKIGNPYQIGDLNFTPFFPRTSLVEEGMASWYGDEFHGRATSNGGRFDMNLVSAAHRTLPLPAVAVIVNLQNGRKVKLIINDRGPFAKDRILDLSKQAARVIGYYGVGTAPVRVIFLREETLALWRQMGFTIIEE